MKWEEEGYTRRDENGNLISLEEYEARQKHTGLSRIMTKGDLKLYAICGVGFMLDAYDLFIVNLATPIWQYEYWGGLAHPPPPDGPAIPTLLQGAVKAAANIGNVFGQISFGLLGDAFGRKFVYGKELIIAMIGIILVISLPNSINSATNKMWWLFAWRVVLGIGIGGDYPMSAAIVAERSTLRNRGRMLGWIFSNQGWGNLLGAIVTLILLGCFHGPLSAGDYGKLDGVWRLQIGLALVPCAVTLYFRLTMPESRKFLQSGELSSIKSSSAVTSATSLDSVDLKKAGVNEKEDLQNMTEQERRASVIEATVQTPSNSTKFKAFADYFSEWRHLKILIGTTICWFLVDISFYGVNLNQSVILSDIGFSEGATEYTTLIKNGYGNLIISIAGYVPGYFFTIAFIEILGRKWIQIQGFLVTALLFGVIAGDFAGLGTGGLFVCFALAQFFFNFGANATTFIIPGEAFPSRVRGLAHGVSAAVGKLGAILAGVLFNWLVSTGNLGLPNTLWVFFALNVLGAIWTFIFVPETKGYDADAKDYEEVQEYLKARGVV